MSKLRQRFLKGAMFGAGFTLFYVVLLFTVMNTIDVPGQFLSLLANILVLPAAPGVMSIGFLVAPAIDPESGASIMLLLLLSTIANAVFYALLVQLIGWMLDQRRQSLGEIKDANN